MVDIVFNERKRKRERVRERGDSLQHFFYPLLLGNLKNNFLIAGGEGERGGSGVVVGGGGALSRYGFPLGAGEREITKPDRYGFLVGVGKKRDNSAWQIF